MKKIFDIFKRPRGKRKEKERPRVLADYREKNALVISELTGLGVDVEVKELKVADYIVNGTAVERKTVFDFISSMKNRRLLRQLEELQQYDSKLLVIEGTEEQELYSDEVLEDGRPAGMHPNSIRGFLLSIMLKYRTPVIFTKDYADTARFLHVLSKKEQREAPLNVAKKFHNKEEQARYILEAFPGIGPKTAKKLIKRFRTIKAVIDAPEEELREEIGKKADNLIRIINQKN